MQSRTKPQRPQRFTKKEYTPSWPFLYLVNWCEKRKCSLAQSHKRHKDSQRKNTTLRAPSCTWWLRCEKKRILVVNLEFGFAKKCSLAQSHKGHKDSQRKNTTLRAPSCTWLIGVKKENAVSHKATKDKKIQKKKKKEFDSPWYA